MNVLLLCGYRDCDSGEQALGVDLIDRRIAQLRSLNLNVICVVAGQHADEQLRLCLRITETELVYDTQENPNLATNLKAGLAATDGSGCFALPVEVPCPPSEVWAALREGWRRRGFNTDTSIYQLSDLQGAPPQPPAPVPHYGFPLLITRSGNRKIKDLQGFRSLVDARLKYHLASMEFPL